MAVPIVPRQKNTPVRVKPQWNTGQNNKSLSFAIEQEGDYRVALYFKDGSPAVIKALRSSTHFGTKFNWKNLGILRRYGARGGEEIPPSAPDTGDETYEITDEGSPGDEGDEVISDEEPEILGERSGVNFLIAFDDTNRLVQLNVHLNIIPRDEIKSITAEFYHRSTALYDIEFIQDARAPFDYTGAKTTTVDISTLEDDESGGTFVDLLVRPYVQGLYEIKLHITKTNDSVEEQTISYNCQQDELAGVRFKGTLTVPPSTDTGVAPMTLANSSVTIRVQGEVDFLDSLEYHKSTQHSQYTFLISDHTAKKHPYRTYPLLSNSYVIDAGNGAVGSERVINPGTIRNNYQSGVVDLGAVVLNMQNADKTPEVKPGRRAKITVPGTEVLSITPRRGT